MAAKNDVVAAGGDGGDVGAGPGLIDDLLGGGESPKVNGGGEESESGEVVDGEFQIVPTVDDLQAEIARLTNELSLRDKLKLQLTEETLLVDRAASEVLSCESAVEEAKGELKAAKERYDKRVNALRDLVRDMANGQGRLDFDGTPEEVIAAIDAVENAIVGAFGPDPATTSPITELGKKKLREIVGAEEFDRAKNSEEPIGLTDKQVEIVEGDGCQTIADLEKKLRDYPLFLTDLKGFGESAQNRLTASLAAWRRVHPPVVE